MADKNEEVVKEQIKYPGIKAMPFIIGNETFEKLGAIGMLSNMAVYLTTVYNMKTITATNLLNVFNGTTNFATLLGAFLSDTYFGRYFTLAVSTFTSFLGLLAITLTATIKDLHPSKCEAKEQESCKGATPFQMAFLFTSFALMIAGAAGVRPCNLAIGADQFNPGTESGKRGINSFFNWYFFTLCFAQMVSVTLVVYVQSNISWSIGLAIPAALMLLAWLVFLMGSKSYVKVKPQGSPFTSFVQVLVVAFKKRSLKLGQDQDSSTAFFNYVAVDSINSRLPHTNQFRLLDKAAIMDTEDELNPDGSSSNPWNLCSMQQVEETKCVIRVLPIWTSAIIYHVPMVQMQTYAVFQALQSNRILGNTAFKIPAASYTVFAMLALTVWIPIYDRILVPFLQRVTGKEGGITILQRMGIGIVLSMLSMLVAGIVEEKRREIALTMPTLGFLPRRGEISLMSALWLVPQMSLAGVAEAFMLVGQVEFYYKQFPENMRSIGGSLLFCGLAMASYLSSFLIFVVHHATEEEVSGGWLSEDLNKGRLDCFYYVVAGLVALDLVYFVVCARWYKYKGSGEYVKTIDVEVKTV
ncbi:hypothetical protein V2J09_014977 [Rumex salicifolius]